MALEVHQQSPEVAAMATQWPIVDALLGGTPAMREAGETFLPAFPNEDADSYRARLNASTLFPAFRRTLSVMGGKPFARELTLSEDAPPRIRELCQDVDLQGNSLHVFAARLFREALAYGICGALVDYPTTSGARTLADERTLGARPYFVHVRHDQILGWRIEEVGGRARLSQLRIAEGAQVPDGPFGTRTVKRVRVLEPGGWQLYQADNEGKYQLIDEGLTTLAEIPFVPFFGAQTGAMTGVSPLLDLAYLNVQHWNESSDQQRCGRFTRVRMMYISGADEFTGPLTIGPDVIMKLPAGAEVRVVQGAAEALAAGRAELEILEEQMVQTGAELLVAKPGQRTATEAASDAEANKSDLQQMVEAFEDGLDQCLQYLADWLRLPEGGHVSMFRDFGAASLSEASGQLVVQMAGSGLIGKRTALRELQRRGALSPDLDPDAEIEAVQVEGPSLGGL